MVGTGFFFWLLPFFVGGAASGVGLSERKKDNLIGIQMGRN